MAGTITRRPLPALVSLLALLALTGIVWWRVINRDTDNHAKASKETTPAPCSTQPVATPTKTLAPPKTVKVRVLNSTDRSGIAATARTDLQAAGFSVPSSAGNDKPSVSITSTAEIRYGTAGADGARLLHFYFPGSTLDLQKKNHSALVTVSLGNAYKQIASPQQVRKAMAARRMTVQPAASPPPGRVPSASATPSGSVQTTTTSTPAC